MSFKDALAENPAPRKVGHLRLKYDKSLLIAEPDRRLPAVGLPELCLAASLGFGAGAILTLLFPAAAGGSLIAVLCLAAAAAMCVALFAALDRKRRYPRRFVLNFATETLRMDFAAGRRALPRTVLVPFDDVVDLTVTRSPKLAYSLWVTHQRTGLPDGRELLVEAVPEPELPELRQLAHVLRAAFGLGDPSESPSTRRAVEPQR